MEIEDIIRKNKVKRQSYVNVSDQKKVKVSSNYFKNLISRILITIILILGSIIFTKSSLDNKELYKKYVFENTLSFNKINDWYQALFGSVDIQKQDEAQSVFKAINYQDIESYKNATKLTVNEQEIINAISSGIVVYLGAKDDLGNTVIIQGNDGVDIWYSNITDTDVALYDYIETGNVLGMANSNYIYLTIIKDGKYLNYEEYQNLV